MTDVQARVRAAIADHGPIGFDEYMTLALYGPGGFFERPPVGANAHFVTSPHVHPYVFGHCVRDALLDTWSALGEPDPFRVVELGAGDGTLAAALLEAFGELPGPRVDYVAVEISPGARDAIGTRGLASVERLDDLEPFEGAIVANELLDNLPFVLVRGRGSGLVEVRVGIGADGLLVEVEVPWSREGLPFPSLDEGADSTIPAGGLELLETIASRLRRGSALLIDYGNPDGPAGAVRGYRNHRPVGDVLRDPGGTDITAGVDLAMTLAHARVLGFETFGPIAQVAALDALGHSRWQATMREVQSELQRAGSGSQAVRVWETRSRASLLADPSGLGKLWWVLLSRRIPAPGWLGRALDG